MRYPIAIGVLEDHKSTSQKPESLGVCCPNVRTRTLVLPTSALGSETTMYHTVHTETQSRSGNDSELQWLLFRYSVPITSNARE